MVFWGSSSITMALLTELPDALGCLREDRLAHPRRGQRGAGEARKRRPNQTAPFEFRLEL
jgi:hypothetical protein